MSTISSLLSSSWLRSGSLLCVGLDPEPAKFPDRFANDPSLTFEFCRDIIDATKDLVCAFKPQIAYFAAFGGEQQLERTIAHIRAVAPDVPVILDAKRGDIGPTAQQYAKEAFDRYGADAVTVNPYLGYDTIEPFVERGSVFVLCRTSNPGSADLQGLHVEGEPLFLRVARDLSTRFGDSGRLGLVVGATYPAELGEVRQVVGELPLLVPGVGAQGGDAEGVGPAMTPAGGVVVNSSRAVLYAARDDGFAQASRQVAVATRNALADVHRRTSRSTS
ncbi:MAG: orotidine-5'-phosphate decarboxylase [Actinobacteria bacterium]|uniref:Orotidine 5'-phosphate decarboxylase n=1 Tax=freshwater metagenome TaxID=449393 RepID=A0A6J7N3M4_9ZZZZ|nr:orotidine-5'-phosphate decarboxylase [Actinomycetota bacterium]